MLKLLILFAGLGCCCYSQLAQKANQDYATPALRQRAAAEMAHRVRPSVEHTAELVASFGLRPGDAVADVGTGVGYLIPYLVAQVGIFGAVVAEDICPEFLAQAEGRIKAAGWRNVRTVLGTERNPNLPAGQLDMAVLLDTYHHLNYPTPVLQGIARGLKRGGRLVIVDYYRSRTHPGASFEDLRTHIRLDRDEVVTEVQAQGFRLSNSFDHLPYEYVLIFHK
jgi:predicted methyltransferase